MDLDLEVVVCRVYASRLMQEGYIFLIRVPPYWKPGSVLQNDSVSHFPTHDDQATSLSIYS